MLIETAGRTVTRDPRAEGVYYTLRGERYL